MFGIIIDNDKVVLQLYLQCRYSVPDIELQNGQLSSYLSKIRQGFEPQSPSS